MEHWIANFVEVLAKIDSDLFHHKDLNNHDDVDEQCEQESSSPKEFQKFWIIKTTFFAQEEKGQNDSQQG